MQKFLDQDRIDAVLAFRAKLGRPFDARDLDGRPNLARAARDFALDSVGDSFPYLADMAQQVSLGAFLTNGQAKGVLNVLVARESRKPQAAAIRAAAVPAAAPALSVASIPDGRYRVTLPDGDHLALRFESKNEWVVEKFGEGTRKIALRVGGSDSEREWNGVGTASPDGAVKLWRSAGPRVAAAVKVLAESARDEQGWLIAGLAFAQEGSVCFRCGKELDRPESLLVGYGETCADRMGLPWGKTAIPMSVRLAQAGVQAPAPADAEPVFVGVPGDDAADDAAWDAYYAAKQARKAERVMPGDVPEPEDDGALDSDPYDVDSGDRPWTLAPERIARYQELFGKDA